MGYSVKTE